MANKGTDRRAMRLMSHLLRMTAMGYPGTTPVGCGKATVQFCIDHGWLTAAGKARHPYDDYRITPAGRAALEEATKDA